jgi:hypothetical protein
MSHPEPVDPVGPPDDVLGLRGLAPNDIVAEHLPVIL